MPKTAILVDGGFFLKRYTRIYGRGDAPEKVAKNLFTMCIQHLDDKADLYRIFFYDCPPLSKKAHNPVSGGSSRLTLPASRILRAMSCAIRRSFVLRT